MQRREPHPHHRLRREPWCPAHLAGVHLADGHHGLPLLRQAVVQQRLELRVQQPLSALADRASQPSAVQPIAGVRAETLSTIAAVAVAWPSPHLVGRSPCARCTRQKPGQRGRPPGRPAWRPCGPPKCRLRPEYNRTATICNEHGRTVRTLPALMSGFGTHDGFQVEALLRLGQHGEFERLERTRRKVGREDIDPP